MTASAGRESRPNLHRAMPVVRWGAPLAEARSAVVVVHGRGQNAAYMRGITDRLGLADVAFHAPEAHDSSWYPMRFLDVGADAQPELRDALATIGNVLAGLAAEGFGPERVTLLGFSQGACLLATLVLEHPEPYAAVVLFTGGFIGAPDAPRTFDALPSPDPAQSLRRVPVLLATATDDAWVPLFRVEETAEAFSAAGAAVELHVDPPGEHEVTDAAIALARRTLSGSAARA